MPDEKKRITPKDLPTVDEMLERYKRKEALLKSTGNASEILKEKNTFTYNFISDNFEMIERQDKDLVTGTFKTVAKSVFFGLLIPAGINIGLGKITNNRIFELHGFVRFNLRLSLFVVPIYFISDYALSSYIRISMYLIEKYSNRIEEYQQKGDPRIINPYFDQECNYEAF
jgi:hypothetical protein